MSRTLIAFHVLAVAALSVLPVMAPSASAQVPAFQITLDSSRVPELEDWSKSLRPIVDAWYPIIVAALQSDGYTAPTKVRIEIRDEDGIAYASGTRIVLTKKWFTEHREDRGAVV